MVLSMLEQTVGSDKFNQLLQEYHLTRHKIIDPSLAEDKLDAESGKD
jgi:hypothetical protein